MKNLTFEPIILREKITSRGGGIEISLDDLGFIGEKMSAYQNYLGGGILGRVVNDCTVVDWRENIDLQKIGKQLKEYYFNLTNPDDEFNSFSFEQNQKLNIGAY